MQGTVLQILGDLGAEVIAVEPLEALRYRQFLRPGGWVVASTTPFVNIPNYPESDTLLAELAQIENIVLVDTAHFARAAGNRRSQNMVTVGAASPLLDFADERMLAFVEKLFARKGEKTVRVNQRAFRFGDRWCRLGSWTAEPRFLWWSRCHRVNCDAEIPLGNA